MWRPVRLASIALLLAAAVVAQQPASLPAFDVASVQPFIPPAGGWAWGKPDMDPQHFRMPGAPLRYIVLTAYGLDDYQLTGLPDWAAQEFFSITAGTDAPTPPD